MSIARLRRDWDELAEMDPMWAILSDPAKRSRRWQVDDFFRTGEQEITALMARAARLGYPRGHARALDFGCGVGRLTRALSAHFDESYGVDISGSMIEQARVLNESSVRCTFVHNPRPDLAIFPSAWFDLIYTNIVLQHLPNQALVREYLNELVRVLKPDGLLVFQLLTYLPWTYRLQPRRRLYAALRAVGVDKTFLHQRLRLAPIPLNFVREEDVGVLLAEIGATLLSTDIDSNAQPPVQSRVFYVTRPPATVS